MSFEQIKREVALLDERQQPELISYTLKLRYAYDAGYHREVTDRLNARINLTGWYRTNSSAAKIKVHAGLRDLHQRTGIQREVELLLAA